MKDLTSRNYKAYERAFDKLNAELFGGELPSVVLTLRAGKGTNGYAWAKRFKLHDSTPVSETATVEAFDEIAINPATASRPARDVLGTLLHEMCHIWQFNFGKPSRNGYHNREWANKMLEVGLKPFNVKDPESMVGQGVSHTIEAGGRADELFAEIVDDFGKDLVIELPFDEKAKKKPKNSKVKFTCPSCGCNAWGKDTLHLTCGDCDMPMLSDADEGGDMDDEGEDN